VQSGLIFDVERYSTQDGPGIRTTVFLFGCPLSCTWCHNPESQGGAPFVHHRAERCIACGECVEACPQEALSLGESGVVVDGGLCRVCANCVAVCPAGARELVGRRVTVEEVLELVERDRLFYDQSGGGVTFSGGEPLAQPAFLLELLEECGRRGLHRAVDTTGLATAEDLEAVAGQTDLFLYDLKLVDPGRHLAATGVPSEPLLANLRALCAAGAQVEVRMPLVGGVSDGTEEVEGAASFLCSLEPPPRVTLLPFHRAARGKHREFARPWRLDGAGEVSEERVREVAAHLARHGLRVRIGGAPRP